MVRLTVLLGMWQGWRSVYEPDHVRAVARMSKHYLLIPHRVVLLTDYEDLLAEPVKWGRYCEVNAILPVPEGPQDGGVNCYRRLRYFDPDYSQQFGTPWIMSLDLDVLMLGDLTDLVQSMMTPFGFAIIRAKPPGPYWGKQLPRDYNGSLYLLKVGEHRHVWDEFDPIRGPATCRDTGWIGSDQVWLSLKIQGAPTIGPEHGSYFYEQYLWETPHDWPEPRILHYSGFTKPWGKPCKREAPELYAEYMRWYEETPRQGPAAAQPKTRQTQSTVRMA